MQYPYYFFILYVQNAFVSLIYSTPSYLLRGSSLVFTYYSPAFYTGVIPYINFIKYNYLSVYLFIKSGLLGSYYYSSLAIFHNNFYNLFIINLEFKCLLSKYSDSITTISSLNFKFFIFFF